MVFNFLEDTGPGIPMKKRDRLFCKYQESLDSLSQGTGIGLFLCSNLVRVMGGELTLDQSYDSGIEGFPGARFAINLNASRVDFCFEHALAPETHEDASLAANLPDELSVLFVDDDLVLRKLFLRTVKKVAPGWNVHEASSGERAIQLVESGVSFDLIFVDQYMASAEVSLLGTETVAALRSKGVDSRICGISANDTGEQFMKAGANAFTFKPFPCAKDALRKELLRILYS